MHRSGCLAGQLDGATAGEIVNSICRFSLAPELLAMWHQSSPVSRQLLQHVAAAST